MATNENQCPEEVMVKLSNKTHKHKESKMKSNTMHITTFTFFIFKTIYKSSTFSTEGKVFSS